MKKISTDIYTFSDLREMGFHYVDKTAGLLSLIDLSVGKQFFCARPRRFGKSLTVTTLQSIFEGRREFFKDLAIDRSDYDWKTYPVIHIDFSRCSARPAAPCRRAVGREGRASRVRRWCLVLGARCLVLGAWCLVLGARRG